MSRPDRDLLALSGAGRPTPKRDARIDAFRGLALAMIFINHIPGNPYEALTTRSIGFSDAAEAFFVMSGIAAGLAYAARFAPAERARAGLWRAVAPIWKRAWTLYLVQLFLTVWAIAIFVFAAELVHDRTLLGLHNLAGFFTDPHEVLFGIPTLGHQIGYVNILPTYIVLLMALPLILPLLLRRPWLAIGLSAALWFAAGYWRLHIPSFPRPGEWQLNPFAWQLVFVIGVAIGVRLRANRRLVPAARGLFWTACAALGFVTLWMHAPPLAEVLNHQLWRLGEAGAPFNIVSQDKVYLGLPRLLHILAVVYVLSCLPRVTALCAHPAAAPLRLMGRHGLLVFSAGTLAALSLQLVLEQPSAPAALRWLLPPLGLAGLVGLAYLAERSRALLGRPRGVDTAPDARSRDRAVKTA